MNDEGIEIAADRIQSEFQRLDEETKEWHNNKRYDNSFSISI